MGGGDRREGLEQDELPGSSSAPTPAPALSEAESDSTESDSTSEPREGESTRYEDPDSLVLSFSASGEADFWSASDALGVEGASCFLVEVVVVERALVWAVG